MKYPGLRPLRDAVDDWRVTRREHGATHPATAAAGVDMLRSLILDDGDLYPSAVRAAEGGLPLVVLTARQTHGKDSAAARLADGLQRIYEGDTADALRVIRECAAAWGPYAADTLELGALASVRYPDFPDDYRLPIAAGLAAHAEFGPAHPLTLLAQRDAVGLQRAAHLFPISASGFLHGVLARAEDEGALPSPADVLARPLPERRNPADLTMADVREYLPERAEGRTDYVGVAENVAAYLDRARALLGEPALIFGPEDVQVWELAEGRLHLRTYGSISADGTDNEWSAHLTWLSHEEVDEWDDAVYLDSKAGTPDSAAYQWCITPYDAQQGGPDFFLGAWEGADWEEVRSLASNNVSELLVTIRMIPSLFWNRVTVTWSGPATASLEFDPDRATLVIDGETTHVDAPLPADLDRLLERMFDAFGGYDPDDFEREARMDGVAWAEITAG